MPEADSPPSDASHESDNDSQHAAGNTSKGYSIKDKECPYCQQKFTSSSLGRHLDQYIHKKKPDGIHNVDEIRRMRGTITRRTARNSKKHGSEEHIQDHTANTSGRPSPAPQYATQPPRYIEVPADKLNSSVGVQSAINRLTWHSTGVITDPASINPSPSGATTTSILPNPDRNSPSRKRNFSTYTSDLATSTNSTSPTALADTARALELSLREVLDSLRAATKHVQTPPTPFDFDLPSQTYPSLTLHLLPTPPTLSQTAPFSTLQSIPISAPGPDQLTPLRNRLTFTIDRWKWSALRLAQRTTSNIADEAAFLSSQADNYTSSALQHLNTCFENWMTHSPDARDQYWHVELLRALQAQKDKAAQMQEKSEALEQESNQLRQQVEYLSRCQWPREMALWPPERVTYNKRMREEVNLVNLQRAPGKVLGVAVGGGVEGREGDEDDDDSGGMATENVNTRGDKWDFEKLVGKWRSHVKEDRTRRAPWTATTSSSNNVGSYAAYGANGGHVASPRLDADGSRGGVNGGPVEGSPVIAGGGTGDGLGIGSVGAPLRRDKPPFGKGNDVRIVSDW